MNFEEYLISKKIDSVSFSKGDPILFQEWKTLFDQMSPESFTSQKLYLINPLRRKFLLKEEAKLNKLEAEVVTPQPSAKPIIRPKIN
jgi:hypothetical protein